jgi:hypothetical protein
MIDDEYAKNGLSEEALESAIMMAEVAGCDIIRSTPVTLLLDLDSSPQYCQFQDMLPILRGLFPISKVEMWDSRSKNTHVRITMSVSLPIEARYALQSMLGSDPIKEILSLKRTVMGIREPSLLFRPPEARVQILESTAIRPPSHF